MGSRYSFIYEATSSGPRREACRMRINVSKLRKSGLVNEDPQFARYGYKRGPIRTRNLSQPFRATQQANLVLQLRALFGINVRCEIVAYLLTHEAAHPSRIASDAYYFVRAVQNAPR